MKIQKALIAVFLMLSAIPSCGEMVMKSLQMVSYYDKIIFLEEIEGLTLFGKGAGVNSYGLRFAPGGGGSGKNSYSTVTVNYPIVVKWRVEGEDVEHTKSFESLDGFTGNEINEEVTIWLYFDKKGEPNFKVFWDDHMVSRRRLEEVVWGRVWKSLRKCSYYPENDIYIREVQGLGSLDLDYETYQATKKSKSFNRLKLRANKLDLSEYTYSSVKLNYPITVKWSFGDTNDIKSKSFDSIADYRGSSIDRKATIWLYFDKSGEPKFKVFWDDWMASRKQLEKSIGLSSEVEKK